VLLAKVEGAKFGGAGKPGRQTPIRRRTDTVPAGASGHVAVAVQRVVWQRDDGRCAFVSTSGQRCTERTFLEFHHIEAFAKGGPATVDNISLRCWSHNQYEAQIVFGRHADRTAGRSSP
jgi:hypothetical protein